MTRSSGPGAGRSPKVCSVWTSSPTSPRTWAADACTCRKTRQALTDSQPLLDSTAPSFQPLQRALLELAEHQLSRVEHAGASITRRTVGYGLRKPLSVLLRERRIVKAGSS